LNEQQYRSLCEACDRVLLAPDSTMERVAIPWLHIIREHPVFLANYADLFEPAGGIHALFAKRQRTFRNRAGWFRQLLRSIRADGQPWYGPEKLQNGIDILFVSHLLNSSHAGQSHDFYFGRLPDDLVKHGHSVVIALINHSGQAPGPLADKWKESALTRVILSESLRFREEMDLRRRLRKESFYLRILADAATPGLARRVADRASEEAVSGGSLTTLRMAKQIGSLVAAMKPKAIVLTHEGHSWERVAFAAARKAVPEVQCIGYQHAALFRLQHAIRRNLAAEYNPGHIVTAGAVAKGQLDRAPRLNGIPISVLGSNRTLSVEKGAQQDAGSNRIGSIDRLACLVLPEGIASECHLLFEFSLACARSRPEIQFIWRLHPILSFKSLAAKNKNLRNLPRNISLSQAMLEEDIARCSWALYRGTTAVVQAVVAGLRPLYLQMPDELIVDPLYELAAWRKSINSVEDFCSVTQSGRSAPFLDEEAEFREAERYCRDFFTPLNPQALESITSVTILGRETK
jgi:hypothetical protein